MSKIGQAVIDLLDKGYGIEEIVNGQVELAR